MGPDVLFLSLFVGGWLACAGLSWLAVSARRRGRGALITLPAALIWGCIFALLLPVLGMDGWAGLALSFPAAALGGLAGVVAVTRAGEMMGGRPHMAALPRDPGKEPHDQDRPLDDVGSETL
ncbi:MAG: hypothetical protein WEB00_11930 [Dehalococcoidia bacterium]